MVPFSSCPTFASISTLLPSAITEALKLIKNKVSGYSGQDIATISSLRTLNTPQP